MDRYSGDGRIDHYAELAHEVISTGRDLIFASSGRPIALHFKSMTTTIPVVPVSGDPIANGLVQSLARPGGNGTGASVDADYKTYAKRFELLGTEAFKGWLSCIAAPLGVAHQNRGGPGGS